MFRKSGKKVPEAEDYENQIDLLSTELGKIEKNIQLHNGRPTDYINRLAYDDKKRFLDEERIRTIIIRDLINITNNLLIAKLIPSDKNFRTIFNKSSKNSNLIQLSQSIEDKLKDLTDLAEKLHTLFKNSNESKGKATVLIKNPFDILDNPKEKKAEDITDFIERSVGACFTQIQKMNRDALEAQRRYVPPVLPTPVNPAQSTFDLLTKLDQDVGSADTGDLSDDAHPAAGLGAGAGAGARGRGRKG